MHRFPRHILFLFGVYAAGISFFTLFRLLLVLTNLQQIPDVPDKFSLLARAFVMGFRFDTVVSGYVLAGPLVALSIVSLSGQSRGWLLRIISWFMITAYGGLFFAGAADIPYFRYYFSRLTVASLNWTDAPAFMVRMIFSEVRYFIYFILFAACLILFAQLVVIVRRATWKQPGSRESRWLNLGISLLACGLLFVGIRGRVAQKSPIRAGTAYFCNYAFINQLGLNASFTFIRSALDARQPENQRLELMDEDEAQRKAHEFLKIPEGPGFGSPLARRVTATGKPLEANVILIIMESMAAAKMARYGNADSLTPVMDSLAKVSYCFDNIYTDGTHTFNGIYATLFSFPTLLKRHPMKATIIPEMTGFARTLSERGYCTIFFTTHDEQFDNMGGFLRGNWFQSVISQKDYPREKILSTLGVPDDYLYEFAIPKLTDLYQRGRPFFCAMLTASDHGPYIIPKWADFKPRSSEARKQIVEYADWSVGRFLRLAQREDWYRNTIFVFVADHGAVWGASDYDMPLSYFHTPLIIFAPGLLPEARASDVLGGQVDIFPTVMGILNVNYVNNTFGIDLLREARPAIFFTADDKIGCLNREFFLVHRQNGLESVYKYRTAESNNYLEQYPASADSLRTYAFSMLQAAQGMIEKKKTN